MHGTEGSTVLEPLWDGLPTPDAASVSGSVSCALPAHHRSVSGARDFTRRTLQRWGLTEEFDDVALVVTELVTNAMRHGLTPGADHGAASGDEGGRQVRLHLTCWSARLVCAVRDPSDQPPDVSAVRAARAAAHGGFGASGGPSGHGGRGHGGNGGNGGHGGVVDADDAWDASSALAPYGEAEALGITAESGRGLCLVDSFSDTWGWHPLPGPLAGKVVWALFRVAEGAGDPAGTRDVMDATDRRTPRL
ncbi:ATP-binding protein [Streptomyces reniochalinae]|uniref:ATP-binding protein n=1 Tax=Streptomyces reniochalinae TaxID=2250578 RepID=A0A367E7V8_9ACTN|nr:ATP-binding protein [Streptomyces reniochalinae]RCG13745.1 ATP-binding protein [Streptomyces reniochalinae]